MKSEENVSTARRDLLWGLLFCLSGEAAERDRSVLTLLDDTFCTEERALAGDELMVSVPSGSTLARAARVRTPVPSRSWWCWSMSKSTFSLSSGDPSSSSNSTSSSSSASRFRV
eukprot:Tamp_31606.p1 GENE.Tamp_31606~~Tamp_31606.p1  ORF type:complete len:114 (+),score=13.88 Tamp_31606:313-654(+)